jgi:hypothetical protein
MLRLVCEKRPSPFRPWWHRQSGPKCEGPIRLVFKHLPDRAVVPMFLAPVAQWKRA